VLYRLLSQLRRKRLGQPASSRAEGGGTRTKVKKEQLKNDKGIAPEGCSGLSKFPFISQKDAGIHTFLA
jgi:hypothetical protein